MTNLSGASLNNGAAVGPQGEGRDCPSTFPKYPAYKDSRVPWIGEVPAAWEVKPFKWLLDSNDGGVWGDDPTGEGDTLVLRSTDQTVDGNWKLTDPAPRNLSAKERASALLIEGDLVVTKSSGSSLHIGKTTLVTADIAKQGCCYGNFMQRLRVNSSFTPKLAWYVMNNELARAQLDLLSNSTTGLANLNGTLIGEILLPVSTVAEQTQIARFLDHETARIDALIEEQQRLIELLKEKRQAVISHAVTKGLDPTVPMKDSGVEWLGEVPAHWESLTLGRVASSVKTGGTPSDDLPSADIIDGVEWYTPGDFTGDLLLDSSEKRVSAGAVRSGDAKVFPSGSVLIVSIGATLGKVGHIRRPASANQQINAVVPGPRVDGYFLAYSLSVKVNAMRFLSNASTIGIMNQEKTKEIWLSLPPLQEQKLITEFLDKQTSVIDTLIQEAAGGVALLQERRSALISAAVTGKIDVRGWQPPASTQTPEFEVAEAH